MRNSFVFYGSWWEAIKNLPRDVQGDVLTAIIEYGLTGETTEQLKPIAKAMLAMAKTQIDINNQRFENGKKGGRGKSKSGQTETKQKPSENQNETNQKPNVNDNVNANEKENPLSGEKENPINPIFDLELDECERLVRSQEEWKQTLCMNNRSSGFGWFTMEDLDAYITKFFMKLRNEGGGRKTLKDAKSHFARWLAIELKNDMSGYNRELRNSTDDKELKSFISYMERKCPNCFVNMKMPNEEQFGNLRKTMDKKEIAELSEKIENRKTLQGNRNSLYATMLEMKEYG